MATAERAASSPPAFMARLLVTLGALALYRLGAQVPLAGIDHAVLAELYRGSNASPAIERVSIFALGVAPLLTALLMVELLRLISERFDAWAGATPETTRLVGHYALIGALLLAAFQGFGLAGALEGVRHLVTEPGAAFRLGTVATFVASTALIAWLATIISRHGLGSGLWVLMLAPFLAGLPGTASSVANAAQTGTIPATAIVLALVVSLGLLAVAVALALALTAAHIPLERTLIWPLFIAPAAATALGLIALLLAGVSMSEGTLLYLIVVTCLVAAVSVAQWKRVISTQPAGAGSSGLMLMTVLTLAGITAIPELAAAGLDTPLLIDGRTTIVAAAVALVVQSLIRASEGQNPD